MTDQQHYNTIGKNSLCKTPNINKLMERGTVFNNAFCPSPICTPARTSFQTGLLPHQHKLMHNAHKGKNYHIQEDVPDGIKMLGGVLSEQGYRTVYLGKWDSGLNKGPIEHGYQYYEDARGCTKKQSDFSLPLWSQHRYIFNKRRPMETQIFLKLSMIKMSFYHTRQRVVPPFIYFLLYIFSRFHKGKICILQKNFYSLIQN